MKCRNCGAELSDGAKFCRECGTKVELPKKRRFCRECGAELKEGGKFCPSCGAEFLSADELMKTVVTPIDVKEEIKSKDSSEKTESQNSKSASFLKSNSADSKISFSKKNIVLISIIAAVVILVICIVALCMSKGESSSENGKTSSVTCVVDGASVHKIQEETHTIEKGTEYAFMSDEKNVYIATAVSDSHIKIERWGKTFSIVNEMKYSDDIGTYKINDSENGFGWLDEEHTAFVFTFSDSDSDNSRVRYSSSHVFTINPSSSNEFKGTDYNEKTACYKYICDDSHVYRAIPLSDSLIKIECWAKANFLSDFCFGWDFCVIDLNNNSFEFEWTDDDHTSFTITTRDKQNEDYWETEQLVLFELENASYEYANISEYISAPPKTSDKSETASSEVNNSTVTTAKNTPITEKKTTSAEKKTTTESKPITEKTPTTEKSNHVYYSTNDKESVKNGNTGVYSYRNRGGYYYNYYIIDFDNGYVYFFSDGNGDGCCDRVKIVSGNLNDVLIITYHDSASTWSYGLHFRWKNQPDHLIQEDKYGFEYDFYTTDLDEALAIMDTKEIHDY